MFTNRYRDVKGTRYKGIIFCCDDLIDAVELLDYLRFMKRKHATGGFGVKEANKELAEQRQHVRKLIKEKRYGKTHSRCRQQPTTAISV